MPGGATAPVRFFSTASSRTLPPVTTVQTIHDCRAARKKLGKLALVPTMGALHEGHVSLMSLARAHAAKVAVSIFVNPTQFGPREDYTKYPRPFDEDLEKCRQAGVDLVFAPMAEDI